MKKSFYYFFFLWMFLFLSLSTNTFAKVVKNNFLVISDIHLAQPALHTMEISPAKGHWYNDLDQPTFEKLMIKIEQSIKKDVVATPDFILFLGDIVGHVRTSASGVLTTETTVFRQLKNNFPNTPIFYVFGNNDSLKKNYGSFDDPNYSGKFKSPYDIAKLNSGWENGFLSTGIHCDHTKNSFPCLIDERSHQGYYAAYLGSTLRLIALNTVLFSAGRNEVTTKEAMDELHWLGLQLKTASQHHESVLLAMHIPPGNNVYDHTAFWLPAEQAVFLKMIETYQSTIIGLLASHTHKEEIKTIKNASGKNIAGIYLTAALSTSHGNEPSVKTFYLTKNNQDHWSLANYETFHVYLEKTDLTLSQLYDYQDYYCNGVKDKGLFECLDHVTADKMKKFFNAGNKNNVGVMKTPDDIYLKMSAS